MQGINSDHVMDSATGQHDFTFKNQIFFVTETEGADPIAMLTMIG